MFLMKKKAVPKNIDQDVTARRIANQIIKLQGRIAEFLNTKTAHYTTSQKQILLLIISIFFSAVSLYLIFKALL